VTRLAASNVSRFFCFQGSPKTGMAVRKQTKSPRICAECAKRDKERVRVMKLLGEAVKKMEAKFAAEDFKPTIGDFLKLLQIEKELGQETPTEIKVTWVEKSEPER
jgi:hypothetical protein